MSEQMLLPPPPPPPSMASRIFGTLGSGAKAAVPVVTTGVYTTGQSALRVGRALAPKNQWELGAVVGGVAGAFFSIAFNLPTDTALLLIVGLAVVGAILIGFVLPMAAKTAPLLAVA